MLSNTQTEETPWTCSKVFLLHKFRKVEQKKMNSQIMEFINEISTWLQMIVLVASVVTLAITVGKTANKPNKTQNERLDILEAWKEKVDNRLETGNIHFDSIDESNKITQRALLALMSHAINGNDIAKLQKAKDDLETYLTEK